MDSLTYEEEQVLDAAETSLALGTPLVLCPDCGLPMQLESKKWKEDRQDSLHRFYYRCSVKTCGATHAAKADGSPVGIPGDKATRYARRLAHRAFDILWQRSWLPSRRSAYEWMARVMELPRDSAHIANFTEEECYALIDAVDKYLNYKLLEYKARGEQARFGLPARRKRG